MPRREEAPLLIDFCSSGWFYAGSTPAMSATA